MNCSKISEFEAKTKKIELCVEMEDFSIALKYIDEVLANISPQAQILKQHKILCLFHMKQYQEVVSFCRGVLEISEHMNSWSRSIISILGLNGSFMFAKALDHIDQPEEAQMILKRIQLE